MRKMDGMFDGHLPDPPHKDEPEPDCSWYGHSSLPTVDDLIDDVLGDEPVPTP